MFENRVDIKFNVRLFTICIINCKKIEDIGAQKNFDFKLYTNVI